MPEALDGLVEYFRDISGEHPDWDEYREAMRRQDKSLIRITSERWGPIATGGFPADSSRIDGLDSTRLRPRTRPASERQRFPAPAGRQGSRPAAGPARPALPRRAHPSAGATCRAVVDRDPDRNRVVAPCDVHHQVGPRVQQGVGDQLAGQQLGGVLDIGRSAARQGIRTNPRAERGLVGEQVEVLREGRYG